MELATWVIAAASLVNAVVLAVYAYFTFGIWRETGRTAQRSEELARQARDAFRLQVLVAYQEEIRSAKEQAAKPGEQLGSAWTGLGLMEEALGAAFPNEWQAIQRILSQAVEEWKKKRGG